MTVAHPFFLQSEAFAQCLHQEQLRTARSKRAFVFIMIESPSLFKAESKEAIAELIFDSLASSIRETDVRGWHEQGQTIGIIFNEIQVPDIYETAYRLLEKVHQMVTSVLTPEQAEHINFSFCAFPDDWNREKARWKLYRSRSEHKRATAVMKRAIDIAGSLTALVITFPLLAGVAAAVKLTSEGPVFFRQKRVGQYGKEFVFLKFRSMATNNDDSAHRAFVTSLINGDNGAAEKGTGGEKVFKIKSDSRVTPLGRFLRRTSLDEVPQFINVLKGEMSLVGPRPPIPYEVEAYDYWHRRRLVEVKPGITGLWQVSGRSRTTFDEMVRLDIQYARSQSVWGDLRILSRTPGAVLGGAGAF